MTNLERNIYKLFAHRFGCDIYNLRNGKDIVDPVRCGCKGIEQCKECEKDNLAWLKKEYEEKGINLSECI